VIRRVLIQYKEGFIMDDRRGRVAVWAGPVVAGILLVGLLVALGLGEGEVRAAPASSGGGWRWYTETIDVAGTWGYYHSLAIVPERPYTVCAAYRVDITDDLKYGWRTGSGWVSETVESAGSTGQFVSLALAPAAPYTPQVSFRKNDVGLRFGWRSDGSWSVETAEAGWNAGGWSSLALAPTAPYTPHIAHTDTWPNYDLRYVRGQAGGGWDLTGVDETLNWVNGISLALMPTPPYTPHISYAAQRDTDGEGYLQHAWLTAGGWVSETVYSQSSVGNVTSLAIAPTPPYTVHIAYRSQLSLRHAWLTPGGWMSETVDASFDTGWYPSLAVEPGAPYRLHIAYGKPAGDANRVMHAWGTSGSWETEEALAAGAYPYLSLALEPRAPYAPHILYRQGEYLAHLWAEPPRVYVPAVMRGA
jgi:hypothetical protein